MMTEPRRLSKEQTRFINRAVSAREQLAVSAVTLIEIATIFGKGSSRSSVPAEELLASLESAETLQILPINLEVAREVAAMGNSLKDPNDRVIVATARVHRLRLVTSDQRIIESNLVPVIE